MCNRINPAVRSHGRRSLERNITMAGNNGFARRVPVSRQFLTTRNQALRLSPSNFTQFMKESTVYGVIVDMPMSATVLTTLACYINGAANLYFNNGTDYSGAAQFHPGVVQATRMFVNFAATLISETTEKTDSFELPSGNVHFAYVLTTGGVYRFELSTIMSQNTEEQRTFMRLYQRVLGELHLAQMKDRAVPKE